MTRPARGPSGTASAAGVGEALARLAESRLVPLSVLIELTRRCNLSCCHCYLPRRRARPSRRSGAMDGELSSSEWSRVLEELAEQGTLFLTFTGGEVLLRPDLAEILTRARELDFSVEVFTNATLVDARAADLWQDLPVSSVGVSIYGHDAASHDLVTGSAGSFDRALNGARLLLERGVAVRFKVPLMRSNAASRRRIMALARSLGASWQFDPLLSPGNDGSDRAARLGLGDEALAALFKDPKLCPPEALAAAVPPGPEDAACGAGRTLAAISPSGEVYPCLQWLAPAGDLHELPFSRIWRESPVLRDIRRLSWKDLKPCPSCSRTHFSHCPGLAQLEHGDPLVPPANSCRLSAAVAAGRDSRGSRRAEASIATEA